MVEAGGAAAVKIDDVASLNTAVASPRVCRSAVSACSAIAAEFDISRPIHKDRCRPFGHKVFTGFEDHRILKIKSIPPGIRRAPRPAMWAAHLPAQTWFVCF